MAITYFEKERIFKLDTPNSSYVIGIVDKENFVGHVYYCLLYTSPSPRDGLLSRMPSSA